jgi:NTP pyrophosphatase (non-canonical NTP hydrolase)
MSVQNVKTYGPQDGQTVLVADRWTGSLLRGTVIHRGPDYFAWKTLRGEIYNTPINTGVWIVVDECKDLWHQVFDIVDRTWNTSLSESDRQTHAILTLITEAAEVADCVKKGKYSPRHNGVLDKAHITEEIGDVMYGVVAVCIEFGINPEDAVNMLHEKLAKRYG